MVKHINDSSILDTSSTLLQGQTLGKHSVDKLVELMEIHREDSRILQ